MIPEQRKNDFQPSRPIKRIQELKKVEKPKVINSVNTSALTKNGWQPCGFLVLEKEIFDNTGF
jgi:hypothetical protein